MKLERIILENFLSYESLDYCFEERPLLVQGLNLTDDGQKTNGTGKSGLNLAIEQLMTFTNSRGVSDAELISYGKKSTNLKLFASCNHRRERILIDYTINLKGSNSLSLSTCAFNSEKWKPVDFSTVLDGKKYVANWFAIEREDLFNYFIINNLRFKSFFKASNSEKVALINRFSDASIVKDIELIDLTDLEEKLEDSKNNSNSILGKIDFISSSIFNEKSRDFKAELEKQQQELNEEIAEIEAKISKKLEKIEKKTALKPELDSSISLLKKKKKTLDSEKQLVLKEIAEIEDKLLESKDEIKKVEKLIRDFKETDFKTERVKLKAKIEQEKESLKEIKTKKEEFEDKSKKLEKALNSIEIKLSGIIICPSCNHKFLLDENLDKLEEKKNSLETFKNPIKKNIDKKNLEVKAIKDSIEEIENDISKINSKQSKQDSEKNNLVSSSNSLTEAFNKVEKELNKKKNELSNFDIKERQRLADIKDLESDLNKIDSDIESIKDEIKLEKKSIALIEKQKSQLKEGDNKKRIEELEEELKKFNSEFKESKISVLKYQRLIDKRKQWIINFKQFRMFLANKSLSVIEYHCNRYLKEMRTDLVVKIEGFKVLADGSIKEEINCKIIRAQERSFSSFSGGERGRLLFASILANRYMINETHPYGGLDFLAIDEVFEGVDSEGLSSLIDSAKLLTIPVLLVTHVSVEESDNVLTIVKENGVSKIKY